MFIVRMCKDVLFVKEKSDISIWWPHKHVTCLFKKGGTSVLKIHRNVPLLSGGMFMSIVRVS
jgi:hypothetical protein